MGQVVQTNGDYEIRATEGGVIKLNTGPAVGVVKVTGTLLVEGESLNVTTDNLNIKDNTIVLNSGETGAGITLEYAGIQIDRGTEPPASFLYDEINDTWIFATGTKATGFNYTNSKLRVKEILTQPTIDNGDLVLIGSGSGVVKVGDRGNLVPYEDLVVNDDDVPNKKYVDRAIQENPTFQIVKDNTRVVAFDPQDPVDQAAFPIGPYLTTPPVGQVAVIVENKRVALFTDRSLELRGLSIFPEDPSGSDIFGFPAASAVTLQASNTNSNIRLETNGTGKVEITYALQYNNTSISPAYVDNSTIVYAGTPGTGTSGLYTVNSSYRGELVLKSRALLFSMIF